MFPIIGRHGPTLDEIFSRTTLNLDRSLRLAHPLRPFRLSAVKLTNQVSFLVVIEGRSAFLPRIRTQKAQEFLVPLE
jgi:hypothetical protein